MEVGDPLFWDSVTNDYLHLRGTGPMWGGLPSARRKQLPAVAQEDMKLPALPCP